MKRTLFFLFLFSLSASCLSQDGNGGIHLIVYKSNEENGELPVQVLITRGTDTIKYALYDPETPFRINDLEPTIYKVVLMESPKLVVFYTREIAVTTGEVTELTVSHDDYVEYRTCYNCINDDGVTTNMAANFTVFYGDNFVPADRIPVRSEWGIGLGGHTIGAVSRFAGVGFNMGVSYSRTGFSKDSSLVSLTNRRSEVYEYLGMNMGVFLRLSTQSQRKVNGQGFIFDLGVNYTLPYYFRHNVTYGKTKISERYIHQFTDLRAMVRLGHKSVSLFGEYRLLDFILGNFPELPKYRIGISFYFAMDSY